MNLTPTEQKVLQSFKVRSKQDLQALKKESLDKIKLFKNLRKSKDRDKSINYYTRKIDLINMALK